MGERVLADEAYEDGLRISDVRRFLDIIDANQNLVAALKAERLGTTIRDLEEKLSAGLVCFGCNGALNLEFTLMSKQRDEIPLMMDNTEAAPQEDALASVEAIFIADTKMDKYEATCMCLRNQDKPGCQRLYCIECDLFVHETLLGSCPSCC